MSASLFARVARSPAVRTSALATKLRSRQLHIEAKLDRIGIELPTPMRFKDGVSKYTPAVRTGNLIFLSGHLPYKPGKFWDNETGLMKGTVGEDVSHADAYLAGRQCAVALLSTLKDQVGDLDEVSRIVKVFGVVNCTPGYPDAPKAVNGASDLLMEVFGEKGIHARTSIGTNALPFNVCVEVEMIVEVSDSFRLHLISIMYIFLLLFLFHK